SYSELGRPGIGPFPSPSGDQGGELSPERGGGSEKSWPAQVTGNTEGGIHQSHVAVSLGEVPPLTTVSGIHVFGKQAQVVGIPQQGIKVLLSLLQSAYAGQRFDVPKSS